MAAASPLLSRARSVSSLASPRAARTLLREATLICMILMRHWQFLGRDLFLIEQNGRHRWVDAFELKEIRQPCRVRAQQFHPEFIRQRRRH